MSAPVDAPLTGWGTPLDTEALLPLNVHSNALQSVRFVKAGAGVLYGFQVLNTNASAQFIQVFDKATGPASGDVPVVVFTVAGSGNLPVNWLPGRTFLVGCVLANSSTA